MQRCGIVPGEPVPGENSKTGEKYSSLALVNTNDGSSMVATSSWDERGWYKETAVSYRSAESAVMGYDAAEARFGADPTSGI